MQSDAERFVQEQLHNQEIKAELIQLYHQKKFQEIEAIAKEHGYQCTAEELKQAFQKEHKLSDRDVADLAGAGKTGSDDGPSPY